MPTLKTGGATIVAIAALCLATNSVQAQIFNLQVVPGQSSLTMGGFIDASAINPGFGNIQLLPQAPGADVTSYQGLITIDVTPTTLQLMPGSNVVAQVNGNWAPNNLLNQTLTDPGNYGLAMTVFGSAIGALRFADLSFDFGIPGPQAAVLNPVTPVPSTPMALDGFGNFDLLGQGAGLLPNSWQYLTSGLGNGEGEIDGGPFINFGGFAPDIGTWDGTTLTLPVHSTITTIIQDSPLVTQTITLTGQIVAVIPEPSSVIMAGLGVIGLVAAGFRARKRKV